MIFVNVLWVPPTAISYCKNSKTEGFKMKRMIAVLLAAMLLLSLAACGGKDDVAKHGVLEGSGMDSMRSDAHGKHMNFSATTNEIINYSNLSAALMDLKSGKIIGVGVEGCVADYIAARNEKIVASKSNDIMTHFSMMTMDANQEVYDILNNAIKDMKADGTLDSLIENELKAYIESDPEAKELPKFDGARTIKIGVTGDLPPMDFVSSNGNAAGFNIALLTEIANRAQVNFELVQIETGARPIALSSNKVDAVFWTKSMKCTVCGADGAEKVEGTLVTESYFSDYAATINLKSDK